MPEQIFGNVGLAALCGWTILVLGPRRFALLNAVPQTLIPLGLSFVYAALVLRHFAEADGGFGSLAEVRLLFQSDWVLLAGWIHYLAFDLAIGAYLAARMDRVGIGRIVQAPILAATFLFGPVGFAVGVATEYALRAGRPLPIPTRLPNAGFGAMAVLAAFSLALAVLISGWALVETRLLNGVPVWAKPMKFALSFFVVFATLAIVEQRMSPAWRNGWTLRVTGVVMATATVGEMGYLILMAAQQAPSHFNFATPFTALMYSLMGVGAVSLVVGVAVYGWCFLRDADADAGPALRWGIGWGFVLSAVLTLATAGYMSSAGTHVGIAPPDAPRLPLLGWSGAVGDIRPAHFLALHAMQILPLAGAWFDRRGISVRRLKWLAASYAALTAAVFWQALAGLPLVRL